MAFPESRSIGNGGLKQEPDEEMRSSVSSMNKRSSSLALSPEQIGHKRRKSFGSMNFEEFVANLLSEEEDQVPPHPNQGESMDDLKTLENYPPTFAPEELTPNQVLGPQSHPGYDTHQLIQKQEPYEEMSLEDFLINAGIVHARGRLPSPNMEALIGTKIGYTDGSMQPGLAYDFSGHLQQNLLPDNGYAAPYQVFADRSSEGSSDPSMPQERKTIIDGPPQLVAERKRRRMIKNRESAARSRARRQAYTVELELELNQLKDENAKLKKLLADNESKQKQEFCCACMTGRRKEEPTETCVKEE